MSAFGLPPSPPPGADVLYVWPLTRFDCILILQWETIMLSINFKNGQRLRTLLQAFFLTKQKRLREANLDEKLHSFLRI